MEGWIQVLHCLLPRAYSTTSNFFSQLLERHLTLFLKIAKHIIQHPLTLIKRIISHTTYLLHSKHRPSSGIHVLWWLHTFYSDVQR